MSAIAGRDSNLCAQTNERLAATRATNPKSSLLAFSEPSQQRNVANEEDKQANPEQWSNPSQLFVTLDITRQGNAAKKNAKEHHEPTNHALVGTLRHGLLSANELLFCHVRANAR